VAIVHDVIKKSGQVLPLPSAIFHVHASADTTWVARILSHCIPVKRGKVSSNSSTHEATQFGDSRCPVYFKCLFIQTQPTWALTDTGGGYHLGALNFISEHSPSFSSSILHLPLIAPPNLQLCQPFNHLAKPYRTSIYRNGPITSGSQPLDFYQ
jgi:hypothetical protein